MPAHVSSPTSAENKLAKALTKKRWSFLRNQIVAAYEVDFVMPDFGLIIEVDGYTHLSERRLRLDQRKDDTLIEKGFYVLRFSNLQIRDHLPQCVTEIERLRQQIKQGQKDNAINQAWKEPLRRMAIKKEPQPPVRKKKMSIEEYFLSKEE